MNDRDDKPGNALDTELTTIDDGDLDEVAGGFAWRYWYYRAGLAISKADPSGLAQFPLAL